MTRINWLTNAYRFWQRTQGFEPAIKNDCVERVSIYYNEIYTPGGYSSVEKAPKDNLRRVEAKLRAHSTRLVSRLTEKEKGCLETLCMLEDAVRIKNYTGMELLDERFCIQAEKLDDKSPVVKEYKRIKRSKVFKSN